MKLSYSNNYSGVEKLFLQEENERCFPPLFELNSVGILCVQNLECKTLNSGVARVKGHSLC